MTNFFDTINAIDPLVYISSVVSAGLLIYTSTQPAPLTVKHNGKKHEFYFIPARSRVLTNDQRVYWSQFGSLYRRLALVLNGLMFLILMGAFSADSFGRPGTWLSFMPDYFSLTTMAVRALMMLIGAWAVTWVYFWVEIFRLERSKISKPL